jgi:hypothetical protein
MEKEPTKKQLAALSQDDFRTVVLFLKSITVPFDRSTEAARVKESLERVVMVDVVDEKPTKS